MLTLEQLKAMPPYCAFATGTIENSPEGFYVTTESQGKLIRWVAKRGQIHDWTIYYYWSDWDVQRILDNGDKVLNSEVIKRMVPCNDEAFKMYRF